jgi:hypothetical protein
MRRYTDIYVPFHGDLSNQLPARSVAMESRQVYCDSVTCQHDADFIRPVWLSALWHYTGKPNTFITFSPSFLTMGLRKMRGPIVLFAEGNGQLSCEEFSVTQQISTASRKHERTAV